MDELLLNNDGHADKCRRHSVNKSPLNPLPPPLKRVEHAHRPKVSLGAAENILPDGEIASSARTTRVV
jgi:hypothetical protein